MSHEIRTPMTAILGFTDILAENPTHDESAEAIQVIQRNGHNLLQLINDILDLSKIEAGKQQMDLQTCSPRNIVSEVVSTMQVRADAKRLRLRAAFDANVPDLIQTDPTRLRQILVNLVGNAIKFTEVGEVQMVVRLATASAGGAKLSFDVIDTGIGMSEEQVRMLFRPFSQVDGSATRRFGGTGLGLAVSKRLAEMLGGDIRVHSSPGQGSIFSLSIGTGNTVGLTMPQVSDKPSTTSGTEGIGWKKLDYHILLAEDGPDNQRLIAFLLRKAGAQVELAENGQIAVDFVLAAQQAGNSFDLILMDMQMPVMDGYAATQMLRGAGYTGPIIALTAHAMTGDREKCISAGCDAYITKPIDPKKLVESLKQSMAKEPIPT